MTPTDPLRPARTLHSRLRHHPWYASLGRDGDRLNVYVHRLPTGDDRRAIPAEFEGLPVSIRYARRPSEVIQ